MLINLNKLDEAYQYNLHAVLMRPNDPLANSQLGMTYFELGKPELAIEGSEVLRNGWVVVGINDGNRLPPTVGGDR